ASASTFHVLPPYLLAVVEDALNVDNSLDKPPPRTVGYVYPPEASASERDACMPASTDLAGRVERENATGMVAFSVGDYNYASDMLHDFYNTNGSFFLVALDGRRVEMACRCGYPVVAWPSTKPDDVTKLKHAVANTKFKVSLALISRKLDFLFLRSPKHHLASYFSDVDLDVLASSHMNDPMAINIGVYAVRANKRTKEYFDLCVRMAEESPGTHDHCPPEMNHPPKWGLFATLEVSAGESPLPSARTLAIYPLTDGPLKKTFGKKVLANELGTWHGFVGSSSSSSSGGSKMDDDDATGYYVRRGVCRRYLWMDGHDSPSLYNALQSFDWDPMDAESYVVHSLSAFRLTVAVLLALARRTGPDPGGGGAHFLWTVLDFEPVEEIGVDFQETNFPHDQRSWRSDEVPYGSVARTALAPCTSNTPPPAKSAGASRRQDEVALDAWWALHTAIPEVDTAELLLVNPHFVSAPYATKLERKMADGDYAPSVARKMADGDYAPSVAKREIFGVYKRLKWCMGNPIVNKANVIGRSSAELSCHGKGVSACRFHQC
ncbi:hypothetical protein ACHAWF_007691, partial [Thalassiosira exigua]